MKKVNKLIIASSLAMMMVATVTICFTLAWYDMYPTYRDISLSTGEESLNIHSAVFLRERDAQGKPIFNPAKNVKTVVDKTHTVTGGGEAVVSDGRVIVNFANLSYSLFGKSAAGAFEVQNGGMLDETTMAWNLDYLTFALFDFTYYNRLFPAYLTASYQADLYVTKDTGGNVTKDYVGPNLFSIRIISDNTNGTTNTMLGDPTSATPNPIVKELLNNYVDPTDTKISSLDVTNQDVLINLNNKVDPSPKEIVIQPNPTNTNYSAGMAMALSINPLTLFEAMDYAKNPNHYADRTTKPVVLGEGDFNLEFVVNFRVSNVGGISA